MLAQTPQSSQERIIGRDASGRPMTEAQWLQVQANRAQALAEWRERNHRMCALTGTDEADHLWA